jgi:hypothetical protein
VQQLRLGLGQDPNGNHFAIARALANASSAGIAWISPRS